MDLNKPSKLFLLLLLKWLIIGYIPMMPCTLLIGPSVVGQSPSVGGSFWCCWSYCWYGLGIPYQCLLCDLLSPFLSLYIAPPFVGNLKYIFALESFDGPMISGS